jgi:hypothetical protein
MTLGVILLVIGGLAGVALCAAWRLLPLRAALVLMAISTSVLGAGELLIQDDVTPAEWLVTIVVFATIGPLQAYLVLTDRSPPVAAGGRAA